MQACIRRYSDRESSFNLPSGRDPDRLHTAESGTYGQNHRNDPHDTHGRPDADRCGAGTPRRHPGHGRRAAAGSTVLQRAVGFAREICFCRWLSRNNSANGTWPSVSSCWPGRCGDVVPGTFGRYVVATGRRASCAASSAVRPGSAPRWPCRRWWRSWSSAAGSPTWSSAAATTKAWCAAGLRPVGRHRFQFPHLPDYFLAEDEGRVAGGTGQQHVLRRPGHCAFVLRASTAGAMVVAYAGSCLLCVLGSLVWLARTWRTFPRERSACRTANSGRGCCPWPPGSWSSTCSGTSSTSSIAT